MEWLNMWMVAVAIVLGLSGCDDGDDMPVAEPRMVVEGWIDSGGYPVVLLSFTAVPGDKELEWSESIIRWGVVTLSDGERTVVLTGGPSDDYMPPYRYYSYEMAGVAGRTYTLTAEYQGMKVSSSVTMPEPTPIRSATRTPVEGCDTVNHLEIRFVAPADVPAYYHVSYRINGADRRFLPSMLGTVAVYEPGAEVTMPVYRSKGSFSTGKFQPEMPASETVTVKLERVAAPVYEFWHAFDDATLVEGSIFVSGPGSMPSNIAGGLGVFSASGVSTVVI